MGNIGGPGLPLRIIGGAIGPSGPPTSYSTAEQRESQHQKVLQLPINLNLGKTLIFTHVKTISIHRKLVGTFRY